MMIALLQQYLLYPWALLLIILSFFLLAYLIKKNFVQFNSNKERGIFSSEHRFDKIFITFTRFIIVSLLIIAIASPYAYQEIREQGDPALKILVDRSGSFELFDQDIDKKIVEAIGNRIPVTVVDIEAGNRSAIGNAIRNNMQGNDNILIISDAYSNEGWYLSDAILFAREQNTVVNALDIQPQYDDMAVTIAGPSRILQDAEEEFFVHIDSVGNPSATLIVELDGQEIINQHVTSAGTFSFKKVFKQGNHKMIARLVVDDHFPQNNIYYKTVHVVEKPKVLMVTRQSSPLKSIVSKNYDMTFQTSLPSSLDQYHMVIIDNVNEVELNSKVNMLKEYLEHGNGLLYVGGLDTFEFNNKCNPRKSPTLSNCQVHSLLPVNVGYGAEEDFKNINVVFVIDISGSSGESFSDIRKDNKVAVEKALALELMRDFKLDYRVGAVAFNQNYNLLSPLRPLYENKNLNTTIARLKYQGGTIVYQGLKKAHELFSNVGGSKNVILISDGNTQFPDQAYGKAAQMAADGITIYALGVGANTNSEFMEEIAAIGGGAFYQPNETQKIRIALDLGEDEDLSKFNLEVMNSNSFITRGIDLDAFVTGFNQVVPKSAGNVLVATEKNSPIITTWRFSLGRAAVLSTDNGNKWSAPLYSRGNSKLVTKTVNWLVGDPERVKAYSIQVKDTTLGKPTKINIMSEKVPSLPGYEFSKTELGDKDLYSAIFNPTSTGIFKFDRTIAAVNYHEEYQKLGLNPDLKGLVENSGGGFFKIEEADKLVEKVKQDSIRIKNEIVFYRWPFIIAALAVFIFEIFVRRIRENYLMAKR